MSAPNRTIVAAEQTDAGRTTISITATRRVSHRMKNLISITSISRVLLAARAQFISPPTGGSSRARVLNWQTVNGDAVFSA